MIYYVYQYLREDNSPYYIGMGHGTRMNDLHTNVETPKDKSRRIIIYDELSEKGALRLENVLTNLYGLIIDGTGILENKIHGGHASPRGMLGKKHSKDARLKISLGNSGKIRTDGHKENYRKPKSSEHTEKIRQANLGRADDGRNAKISASKKNKPWTQARRDAQNLKKENTL